MPHAGNFLTAKEVGNEYYYPLRVYYCKKCGLVQILDIVPPNILFQKYHYLSSVSLSEHFHKYAKEVGKRFLTKNSFVVEIGSNDGVLLSPLKKMGIKVLGVDPAKNIAAVAKKKGIKTIVNFFDERVAGKIFKENGKADAILANNVLAHIDDMDNVFRGIVKLLSPDGVLIFEVHYLPDLLKAMQYDFFYTEHLSYYSLGSLIPFLNKFGLRIFDIKHISIHSGSIRVYVKFENSNKYKIKKAVGKMYLKEQKVLSSDKMIGFSLKVYKHKKNIKKILTKIKESGDKIVGYGAGGRANTFLNFCGIDRTILDYIVDDSPERQGKYTPGMHIPIVSPEVFRKDSAKFALLLAWNYKKQILSKENKFIKKGGKFIIPLPKLTYVRFQ